MDAQAGLSRRVLLVVGAIALGTTITMVVLWGRIPDRVALRWDLSGSPDVFATRGAVIGLLGVTLFLAAVSSVLTRRPRGLSPGQRQGLCAYGVFFTALLGSTTTLVVLANAWATADGPRLGWWAAAVLVIPLVAVPLGIPRRAPDRVGRISVARRSDQVLWRGQASARWPFLVAAIMAAIALAAALWHVVTGVVLLLAALLPAALARIEVAVHPDRLTVRYGGALRWLESKIPIGAIEEVEAIEVVPRDHGGWGYRGSLRFLGWASVILWGGPGLLVTLRAGRTFVVTIPGADEAARAIRRVREDTAQTGRQD